MGGTEIAAPLLDIVKKDKHMSNYDRNIILLTDGQVHNTNEIIEIIRQMKDKGVGTTHMVGIGDGVSFDMIRKGALNGGGEHLFILKNEEMQKQIIYLLESITKCQITNFNLEYNQNVISCSEPLIPKFMKKNRPTTFYLKFKAPMTKEILDNEKIKISYFDEETEKNAEYEVKLNQTAKIPLLLKLCVQQQI